MNRKILYSGLAALLIIPAVSMAEETADGKMKTMDEVVITATRTSTSQEKIGGSSVTVITAEDIVAKQPINLKETLRGATSIDMVSNGSPGTSTSVFLRAADSKNTLVMIDGIMFNDSSSIDRSANLADITVDNIERIEIVRGPLSVLYGSNATAGVINIITKKGYGKPSIHAGVEGGSFKTRKAYGGASGSVNKFNYSLAAALTETDGFSSANADNDRIPQENNTSEKDGWENGTLSGRIGVDLTSDFSINAVFRYIDSEIEEDGWQYYDAVNLLYVGYAFDDPGPAEEKKQRTESEQLLGKLSVRNDLFNGFFESDLYFQGSRQERQSYFNTGTPSYDFLGKNREIGWQGGLNFSNNTLSFGASYFEEEMTSTTSSIIDKTADTKSVWLQDQLFLSESFDVVAGVRVDRHERFGSKAIYRIAPAYTVSGTGTFLKASYGTGFRAPSLYELFHPIVGNVNLEAEESVGWDIGFEQPLGNGKFTFGATYFDNTYKNRIAWDPTIPTIWWGAYNQLPGNTDISGVEAFSKWQVTDDLDLSVNYSYTSTIGPDGKRLVRRPLNKCSLNVRYSFMKKGLVNLDIFWVDERDAITTATDLNGNPVLTLDPYTLVNLSARYNLTDSIQIYGRIDNLFDEEYEEAWSYATVNLSGYLGLKLSF